MKFQAYKIYFVLDRTDLRKLRFLRIYVTLRLVHL